MTNPTTAGALWAAWLQVVPSHLREVDGIKAQFAAAFAVIDFLEKERAGSGWTFEPTQVGTWEDRLGIDGYLVCKNGDAFAIDFSLEGELNPRGNKRNTDWLVHLKRDWFDQGADGIWTVRRQCLNPLLVAFKRALSSGPVTWQTVTIDGARQRAAS